MRAFVQNLPRFSSAGSAGTRRILLTGAAVIGVAGLVVVVALHQRNVEQPASIAKTPPADQLPGGIKMHAALRRPRGRGGAEAGGDSGGAGQILHGADGRGVAGGCDPGTGPDAGHATSGTAAANRSDGASRKRARADPRRQRRAEAAANR